MTSANLITLRPATDADHDLAYEIKKAAFSVYVETQYGDWDEAVQLEYHRKRFEAQDFRVVTVNDDPVGIMALVADRDSINVNQLMVRPEHQGKGIGEHCMAVVTREAQSLGIPVRLQVMKVNPRALKFYRRLGFHAVGETDTHYQMESKP